MENKGGHNYRHKSHGGRSEKKSKLSKQRNPAKNREQRLQPSKRAPPTNYPTCDKREPVNSPGSSSCEVSGALTISFFSQTVEWQQARLLSYLYGSLRRRGLTLATSSPPAGFLVTPVQANKQTGSSYISDTHSCLVLL